MDQHLIVIHVNNGNVEAVYVNNVDLFEVRVIDISDSEEADTTYPPLSLSELAELATTDPVRQALERSMECPNLDEHSADVPDSHGLCPRCLTRPLSCDVDGDFEPHAVCNHCDWEDTEP